jgi:hypothetical protein
MGEGLSNDNSMPCCESVGRRGWCLDQHPVKKLRTHHVARRIFLDMNSGVFLKTPWLLGLVLALVAAVIVRGFWLYWASLTWPTADGVITRIDIERKPSGGSPCGHYFSATFTYDFYDSPGHRVSGNWNKDFSTESQAREFAERELPVDKKVVVRFNPKSPVQNNLELDSWTYTGDRPTSLNI